MKPKALTFLIPECLRPSGLLLLLSIAAFAQTSGTGQVPVVTIQATDAKGSWSGDPAVFTIFRSGNPAPALNVYCCISGTASNGVDYQPIGNLVSLPAGVLSNTIVIQPINLGQTNVKTVTLDLCPSPLLTPVNYSIGTPDSATAYIFPPAASNLPPVVSIVSPTNGAVFAAPASISLVAKSADLDGTVTNVEFFAGSTDLGRGLPVVLDPPGVNGVTGLVYFLNWQNVPANTYSLTAVATDNTGAATTSAPVSITVQPLPTNLPPVVRITSPANGSVFRAPLNLPLYAYATDPDGSVASVQFFAGGNSLGFARKVTAVPPPLPPGPVQPPVLIVVPTNYWELLWTNVPAGTNILLTAQATDNAGAVTASAPVSVSILPPVTPPTNRPAVVNIVATDPVAIEGTNCWPWRGLANVTPAWSNWVSATAIYRFYTNCGPKDATFTVFRYGATNDSLDVSYAIGGTATNGIDYVALPGLVTIPAGLTRATITVVPLDDGPPDRNSSVILKLLTGTNYLVGPPSAAAAIILDSQSPAPASGLMSEDTVFHLNASGPDGAWFHVEHSSDLVNWTAICTNQVINGRIDFVDPEAATNPARYYRTVPEAGPPLQ